MSGQTCRTQEGQARYVVFNTPPYCHIEMECKSGLQHLSRFKHFLHLPFSRSSVGTDCHFIFGFFGFPFDSCFGLMFIPLKYMQRSLRFLCIQTLLENQTKWVEGKTFSHRSTCTMVTRGPMSIIIKGWPLCSEQSLWILSHMESIMKGFYHFPLLSNGFRDLPILRLNRKAGDRQPGISPTAISWSCCSSYNLL